MKHCLIVDDSSIVRKLIKQIMESFGFSCVEAENGAIAYELCALQKPSLIMLDWNMPVMDGITFLKKLRQSSSGSDPKVIFCTTENDMFRIQMAIDAGANDFIMKPFDKEIMLSKLQQNNLVEECY